MQLEGKADGYIAVGFTRTRDMVQYRKTLCIVHVHCTYMYLYTSEYAFSHSL